MFTSARTKIKPGFVLLLDIGSSSVGASLSHCDGKDKSRIVYSVRKDFASHSIHSFESHIDCMKKGLASVLKEITSQTNATPAQVAVSFASSWYISQTRTVVMRRSTPFLVKKDLIQSFKSKEEKKFLDEHKGMFGKTDGQVALLESKILDTLVDGYSISNPIGKKATSFSLTLYLAVIPKEVLETVEDLVVSGAHVNHLSFATFQSVAFVGIRDMFPAKNDFLVIDINGEITDLSLIRNDVILESISFPLGENFFKSRLQKHFGWSLSEYRSHLSLYKEGKLHDDFRFEFEEYLNVLLRDWSVYVRRALHSLDGDRLSPEHICLIGGDVFARHIKSILESGQFQNFTHTQNPFHVTIIDSAHLHELCYIQNILKPEPSIILLSYFANRILYNT
jgi:hypothetical protein